MGKYLTPLEMQCDLMRQGFMRPLKVAKKPKPLAPMKACDKCCDWHRGSCAKFQAAKAARTMLKLPK